MNAAAKAESNAAMEVFHPLLEAAKRGYRQRNPVDARAFEDIRDLWRDLMRDWQGEQA